MQVDVILSDGSLHRAAVPSGASTGKKQKMDGRKKERKKERKKQDFDLIQ
jgi:enolase